MSHHPSTLMGEWEGHNSKELHETIEEIRKSGAVSNKGSGLGWNWCGKQGQKSMQGLTDWVNNFVLYPNIVLLKKSMCFFSIRHIFHFHQ